MMWQISTFALIWVLFSGVIVLKGLKYITFQDLTTLTNLREWSVTLFGIVFWPIVLCFRLFWATHPTLKQKRDKHIMGQYHKSLQ